MNIFIGIDVSTTSTKVILINEKGETLSVSSSEYSFETPFPLWSEQDPDLWWTATKESIHTAVETAQIQPGDVKGIGLTGQMHGLVILDNNADILRPSILWNDQRTQKQCDQIRDTLGKKEFIKITGNDALTGFTAPKILWVKEEEPDIYSCVKHILLPKDYVRYRLTGEFATDCADGSGTVLFDLAQRDWSHDLINSLGLQSEWFPRTFEGTQETGKLSKNSAEEIGLLEGTPVFGGGGDQAAAAVGTGAVKEGIVSISLGTSGVVFAATDAPFIDPEGRLHSFCHSLPGKWHLMGVMLSAAGSLRWFRDTFKPSSSFDDLVREAELASAGCDGLFFLPYLTGERTPYPDPMARGCFIGLTVRHDFKYLIRAVLEGVAFGLRDSFELMQNVGLREISQVRITGGGAKSSLWRQIIADILGVEIVTISSAEGAAFGAALLAATGSGMFKSVEEACLETIKIVDCVTPTKNNHIYETAYTEYRMLYPSLQENFSRISKIFS